jgi:DNA repair exonuclease SbcCD nuclease subunit
MNNINIIHLGDLHIDNKYLLKIEPALEEVLSYCEKNKITAVVIPGDLTHQRQSFCNNSGVPFLLSFLKKLSKLVDFVFIVRGNHDDPGSVELLHQIEKNVYSFEYPVALGIDETNFVVDLLRVDNRIPLKYIVTLVPYPTKAGFVTKTSIDNNNADFLEIFEQIFELIGDVTQPYNCPKILGFHGNVVGSRLSTGQTLVSQDIMVAPKTLERAGQHYYALNHIHLRQEIKPNIVYAGGIANFNWGETEQKSFEVVTFERDTNDDWDVESKQVMFESGKPMIKIEADYIAGDIISQPEGINIYDIPWDDAEYRLRITVKENDRKLITDDGILRIMEHFGDVKIEFNMVPDDRDSRSEDIMKCKSIYEEVKEYAKVVEFELPDSIQDKVLTIETELGVKK